MVDEFPIPKSFDSSSPGELDASFVDGSDEGSSKENSGGGGSEEEGVTTALSKKIMRLGSVLRMSSMRQRKRKKKEREKMGTTNAMEATRSISERPMAAPIPLPILGAGSPVVEDQKVEEREERA